MATKEEILAELARREQQRRMQQQAQPQEPSLTEQFTGAVGRLTSAVSPFPTTYGQAEQLASFGTGMVAEPVAGLAGIGSAAFGGTPEEAAQAVQRTREALTYAPQTQAGQAEMQRTAESPVLQAVGKGIQAVESGLGTAGMAVGSFVSDDPDVQAAFAATGATLPTAAMELLGLKGLGKVRGFKKVTGITDDVASELKQAGMDIDSMSPQQVSKLQENINNQVKEQAKRAELFQELDIPTTRGVITRKPSDLIEEQRLIKAPEDVPGAREVQMRKAAESAGFQDATNRLIEQLGAPQDAGTLIKEALDARISGVAADTRKAYKDLAEMTRGNSIPIIGNKIIGRLGDETTSALSGRLQSAERKQINDLLVEFGLDTDPDRVASWVSRRKSVEGIIPGKAEVTPLTLDNVEEFRQGLNNLSGMEASKEMKGVAGALKRGVDEELAEMDAALNRATGPLAQQSKGVLSAAKRARSLFKTRKELENTDGIIGRLTQGKPRTPDEPLILASEVTKKLFGGTREGSIENIAKVVNELEKAGPQGKRALGSMQAAAVADLMDASISSTKLPGDVPKWLGGKFSREFDKMNKNGRLEVMFKDNPEAFAELKKIREAGELVQDFSTLSSSGTAERIFNTLARNPVIGPILRVGGGFGAGVVEAGGKFVEAGKGRKAARRALSMKPDDAVRLQQVRRLYPNMAAVMAPPQLRQEEK